MQTELLTQPNNCKPKGGREGWREGEREGGRKEGEIQETEVCIEIVFSFCVIIFMDLG